MTPTERFVDTGFWLALVNRDDDYHERARALNARLRGSFVTTEAILLEIGDSLSRRRWRALGRAHGRAGGQARGCERAPHAMLHAHPRGVMSSGAAIIGRSARLERRCEADGQSA